MTFKHNPGMVNTKNVNAGSLHKNVAKLCGDDGIYLALKGETIMS